MIDDDMTLDYQKTGTFNIEFYNSIKGEKDTVDLRVINSRFELFGDEFLIQPTDKQDADYELIDVSYRNQVIALIYKTGKFWESVSLGLSEETYGKNIYESVVKLLGLIY